MTARKSCPACSSPDVRVERPAEFRYQNCGLSNVVLAGGGVQVVACNRCGSTSTRVENEPQLLQVIGAALLISPPGMRGEELKYLRTLYGMTQSDMAKTLGTDRRETIAEWESMDRIWAKPSQEIGPRVLLLHMYHAQVIESDFCSLSEEHKKMLTSFQQAFVQQVRELLNRKRASKVSITLRARKKEWETDCELALV